MMRGLIDQRSHEIEKRFIETVSLRKRMLASVDDWSTKPD